MAEPRVVGFDELYVGSWQSGYGDDHETKMLILPIDELWSGVDLTRIDVC
jgi:hypothetical protein